MIGAPLPGRATSAVRTALLSHGWEGVASEAAAAALEPWAHHFEDLSADQVEALVRAAPRFGLDLLTGDGWAVLAGTRSRLSALARSWALPPELSELVVALGTGLPADPPAAWHAGNTVLDLSAPVLLTGLPPGVVEVLLPAAADLGGTGGVLFTASDPGAALGQFTAALDAALSAGLDAERIALDPGWRPGAPPLALCRRFGRPLICTTDDPAVAALARSHGAQVFRTTRPDLIGPAVTGADRAA